MALAADISRIKKRISDTLLLNTNNSKLDDVSALLPIKNLQGKLYEAAVLADVCKHLHVQENFRIELKNGGIILRQKGKEINRNDSYFEVYDINGDLMAELWTDIYFLTLSYGQRAINKAVSRADYHELDIALIKPKCLKMPSYDEIYIAIECKNTDIQKSIIREVLGFRRELSFYNRTFLPTRFSNWPTKKIKAMPTSVHMLYCKDPNVKFYEENCLEFGILLVHYTM